MDKRYVLYIGTGRWLVVVGDALKQVCNLRWCAGVKTMPGGGVDGWCRVVVFEVPSDHHQVGEHLVVLKARLGEEMPVVVMGVGGDLAMERVIRASGIFYYLVAPFESGEVREVVTSALSYHERRCLRRLEGISHRA
jgi:DNA-binding NtrC family response regulator